MVKLYNIIDSTWSILLVFFQSVLPKSSEVSTLLVSIDIVSYRNSWQETDLFTFTTDFAPKCMANRPLLDILTNHIIILSQIVLWDVERVGFLIFSSLPAVTL